MSQVGSPLVLVNVDYTKLEATFTQEADKLKEAALESSALIAQVTSAEENARAVQAQQNIHGLLATIEKARKAAKDKPHRLGKSIDDRAKDFIRDLNEEMGRISALVGSFQQLEQAKANAATQAINDEISEIERARAAEKSQAKSHEELEEIEAKYDALARKAQVGLAPTARATGQIVKNDWEIVVTDIHRLYRFHPNLCDVHANIPAIKNLLSQGAKIQGITATPIVKAGVRAPKKGGVIDV